MNIILIDKTVPTIERDNHKSFNWILTNERFVKKEKKTSYSYRKDYYGFEQEGHHRAEIAKRMNVPKIPILVVIPSDELEQQKIFNKFKKMEEVWK